MSRIFFIDQRQESLLGLIEDFEVQALILITKGLVLIIKHVVT